MFSFDVEVSADYLNDISSRIDGATLVVHAQGGSLETQMDLANKLASLSSMSRKDFDISQALDTAKVAIVNWAKSMNADPQSVANLEIGSAPIWDLFSSDAAIVLKKYFKDKYPNALDEKGKEYCPYFYNIQALAN